MSATTNSVGPYLLDRELGRGAFGVVYQAHDPENPETPVALKVLQARGKIDRLMLEPGLLAKLNHPGIVRVLDYFPNANKSELVIVLEFVGGGDLAAMIEEFDHFPPEVVRDLLVQLASALVEAHGKGVVHRDLKPANILIDRSGPRTRYVLTDFGVGGDDEGLRTQKKIAGTYLFMAPEQLRGRPGPQSDLWALGVVAYRMLAGKYPFPGPTVAELSKQIQLTTPAPPGSVTGATGDPVLERVILRLLERSESERISSAEELLRELGHTGDTRTNYTARTMPSGTRAASRHQTLDHTLRRDYRRHWMWLCLWTLLYMLIKGPITSIFQLIGLVMFYVAHRRSGRDKVALIVASISLILVPVVAPIFVNPLQQLMVQQANVINRTFISTGDWLMRMIPVPWVAGILISITVFLIAVLPFVIPVLASNSYARANRVRRERLLLTAAAASPDEYLALLRRELEFRYEDVGFHLKYAEALVARGDDREAAIEARLLLEQDPYHFNGNLLLAECYLRLGLTQDCICVCNDYLAVSGYCFEFAELRDQAQRVGGRA